MASKLKFLDRLTRDQLRRVADRHRLSAGSGASKAELLTALGSHPSATPAGILAEMSRDELKALCRDMGLADGGREKQILIDRILEGTDADDAPTIPRFDPPDLPPTVPPSPIAQLSD